MVLRGLRVFNSWSAICFACFEIFGHLFNRDKNAGLMKDIYNSKHRSILMNEARFLRLPSKVKSNVSKWSETFKTVNKIAHSEISDILTPMNESSKYMSYDLCLFSKVNSETGKRSNMSNISVDLISSSLNLKSSLSKVILLTSSRLFFTIFSFSLFICLSPLSQLFYITKSLLFLRCHMQR